MKSSEQYLWLEVESDGNGVKGGEKAGAAARSHAARYHHKIKRSKTVVQFSDSRNRTTLLVAPHKANASYQGRWPDKSRQNCFLASHSKSTSTEDRIDHQASLKDQGPSKLAQVSLRKPRGGSSTVSIVAFVRLKICTQICLKATEPHRSERVWQLDEPNQNFPQSSSMLGSVLRKYVAVR